MATLLSYVVRPSVAVFASTGARALYGLALSNAIYLGLSANDAVIVFQFLLLQTIVTSFVAGSSYVRASTLTDSSSLMSSGMVRALLLTGTILLILGFLSHRWIIPESWNEAYPLGTRSVFSLMLLGAVCAGANGLLQGFLVRKVGHWRCFAPATAMSLILAPVVLFIDVTPSVVAVLAVMLPMLNLAALLLTLPAARRIVGEAFVIRGWWHNGVTIISETLSFSSVNCLLLGIYFVLREYFADHVNADLVALVFFTQRLTSLFWQSAYILISTSEPAASIPDSLALWSRRFHVGHVVFGMLVLWGAILGGVLLLARPLLSEIVLVQFIAVFVGQTVSDIAEFFRAIFLVDMIRERKLLLFAASTICSSLAAVYLTIFVAPIQPEVWLIHAQILAVTIFIAIWLLTIAQKKG